jgi:hypothetical protein
MKEKQLSKAEMARGMRTSRAALDRLLDPEARVFEAEAHYGFASGFDNAGACKEVLLAEFGIAHWFGMPFSGCQKRNGAICPADVAHPRHGGEPSRIALSS